MYIQTDKNGRLSIREHKTNDLDENIIKDILRAGLNLSENTRYYLGGDSRMFFILRDGICRVHRYRENWNGWHDCFKILPDGSIDRRVISEDPSIGAHRQSFVDEQ